MTCRRGVLRFLVPALAGVSMAGCTLIGLSMGAVSQHKAPATSRVSPWDLEKLEAGRRVSVLLRDGSRLDGTFDGIVTLAPEHYQALYAEARQQLAGEADLPALGEGATVETKDGRRTAGALVGFGHGTAVMLPAGAGKRTTHATGLITRVADAEGHGVDGATLESLIGAGKLPLVEAMQVSVAEDNRYQRQKFVRLDTVNLVEIRNKRNQAAQGALAGAAIDGLVIVILAVASSSDAPPPTTTTQSSCPFVYVRDGSDLRLEAEPLAGSIAAAAERTDRALLPRLRPEDGLYRVRIANALDEVDYLDEIALVAVDHAPGASVSADLFGGVHAAATSVAPSAARDLRGASVLDLVARRDGRSWAGDPLNRDPDRTEDLAAGVVADFPRPAGARGAVLTLVARSAPQTSVFVQDVLALKGRDLDRWYAQLDTDMAAQLALWRFALEGAPAIRVWTGSSWRVAGLLAALPTVVDGTQAVVLDLGDTPRDVLRVRVDGLPGSWTLDALSVAYDEPSPAVAPIGATTAVTNAGEDVREVLAAPDKRRLVLRKGEHVDLTFPAARVREGRRVSLLLKATGFYRPLIRSEGEPQTALFDSLMAGRGDLARHWIRRAKGTLPTAQATAP